MELALQDGRSKGSCMSGGALIKLIAKIMGVHSLQRGRSDRWQRSNQGGRARPVRGDPLARRVPLADQGTPKTQGLYNGTQRKMSRQEIEMMERLKIAQEVAGL
jgi:hypothetical protein